jgi:DNA-binding beta-propeller fold protein YncE
MLIVTGDYQTSTRGIATIRYDAQTGDRLWLRVWNGPDNIQALSRDVVMAPDGQHVFVGGIVYGPDTGYHYAILKYATVGAQSWARRYQGVPGYSEDFLTSIALTPDGGTVFATGYGSDGADDGDFATLAYDAGSGAKLWTRRLDGGGSDFARSVAVDPTGGTVFVTGSSDGSKSGLDFLTVEYDASTGMKIGAARYEPGFEASDLVLTGGSLVISGTGTYMSDDSGAGLTAAFAA